MPERNELFHILKSLVPTTAQELSALRYLLYCAHLCHKGAALAVPAFFGSPSKLSWEGVPAPEETDFQDFLVSLTSEARRLFHGLVEALEIYQSIHGEPVPIQNLTLSDNSVYELRQIRDMCLEDGLHSIY